MALNAEGSTMLGFSVTSLHVQKEGLKCFVKQSSKHRASMLACLPACMLNMCIDVCIGVAMTCHVMQMQAGCYSKDQQGAVHNQNLKDMMIWLLC